MFKNLKSALNVTKTKAGVRFNEKDLVSEKRRKQKEKEAKKQLNGRNNNNNDKLVPIITSKSSCKSKSLGSKKLANVMSRLRLITSTSNKRKKVSVTSDVIRATIEQQEHLLRLNNFNYNHQHHNEYNANYNCSDSDDNLSFYSAMTHFEEDCTCPGPGQATGGGGHDESIVVQSYDSTDSEIHTDSEYNSADGDFDDDDDCLEEGKFILPEEQCDIPTFLNTANCDRKLIDKTRNLLRERYLANPESFYRSDYERMLNDDWTVTRFLLRRRKDPKRTAKLMEECGKFRIAHKMGEIQLHEFPREFHRAGGLFAYAPDRVGNITLYLRVRMYRRVPEISDVFKAWLLCVLEQCDVASKGRGTAVVFDLSSCGLQNIDLTFLYWLLSSFRNYCPKGVSYIIVYNLPWILSATAKLAMTWLSETNRRALRFVQGKEIENFIARENLPDYLGGTCKINYRRCPAGSRPATEVCERLDMTPQQALKIKDMFKEYLKDDDDDGDDYDSLSQYGDAESLSDKHEQISCHSSVNSSRASTALISESGAIGQLEDTSSTTAADTLLQPPTMTFSSQNSLVPVVDLVTQASKFIAH